ncbi:hypothetical protein [uncultured Sphingomonas sp.]|uniref:hypothetical protein n=1 Tax=uncultured Sphingomonas sp. TaxID=158754 RepID=UPI0025FA4CBD|nr:hypothetical protein [uncultured Sphingomonas sp.]
MRVIEPVTVTADVLTSINVPEDEYPLWDATKPYVKGSRVIRGHRCWEGAADTIPAGTDPLTETGASKWADMGATRQWAMFDQAKGTLTTRDGPIVVTLTPGRIDSLVLLELTASKVTVAATVNNQEVWRRVQLTQVGGREIDNIYDWLFAPIGKRERLLFDDLPSYRNAIYTVTIEGASSTMPVACGTLLIGAMLDIGKTGSGVDIGIVDFSKKQRNDYGVITVQERGYSDSLTYSVAVQMARIDAVKKRLADLRATPTVWIGSANLDAMLTYGYFNNFKLRVARLTGIAVCDLGVESL